jgi:hypothetical protein
MLDAIQVDNPHCSLAEASAFVDGWVSAAAHRSGLCLPPGMELEVIAVLRASRRDYYRKVCEGVLTVADRWRDATTFPKLTGLLETAEVDVSSLLGVPAGVLDVVLVEQPAQTTQYSD